MRLDPQAVLLEAAERRAGQRPGRSHRSVGVMSRSRVLRCIVEPAERAAPLVNTQGLGHARGEATRTRSCSADSRPVTRGAPPSQGGALARTPARAWRSSAKRLIARILLRHEARRRRPRLTQELAGTRTASGSPRRLRRNSSRVMSVPEEVGRPASIDVSVGEVPRRSVFSVRARHRRVESTVFVSLAWARGMRPGSARPRADAPGMSARASGEPPVDRLELAAPADADATLRVPGRDRYCAARLATRPRCSFAKPRAMRELLEESHVAWERSGSGRTCSPAEGGSSRRTGDFRAACYGGSSPASGAR